MAGTGPISPDSGRDRVKSLQSSYTGLHPQRTRLISGTVISTICRVASHSRRARCVAGLGSGDSIASMSGTRLSGAAVLGVYRGTSLIKNFNHPRTTIRPWA